MNQAPMALVLMGLWTLSAGCRRDAASNERKSTTGEGSAGASLPRKGTGDPITLLEWKESAYGTTLFIEGSTALVLTQTAAIRVTEGTPPQKMAVPFGVGPALMGDSIVYFHDGAARAVAKSGSEPRKLGLIEHPPQRFVASEKRLAWLDHGEDGTFSLQKIDGKTPRVFYRTKDQVATATMLGDWVFVVERQADGSWRIAGVSTSKQESVFSRAHQGRPPSMLVPAPDGIYFYDGPTRSVRLASPDLQQETVFAENVICSPFAVSDRVVCAHVEGVFEIPGKGRAPRVLAREKAGPIAAIAADEKRAVWLVDTAKDQFAVRSVALPVPR